MRKVNVMRLRPTMNIPSPTNVAYMLTNMCNSTLHVGNMNDLRKLLSINHVRLYYL